MSRLSEIVALPVHAIERPPWSSIGFAGRPLNLATGPRKTSSALALERSCARRSDVDEEASIKTAARRWRDFPDIPSASSALAERLERVYGRSHSIPRRRHSPRRTSGCGQGPGLAEDADPNALVVDIETDVEQGCLLKSMGLGTAATGFQVSQLTGASFIADACRFAIPLQPGTTHVSFSTVRLRTLFLGSLNIHAPTGVASGPPGLYRL
jgi:hypothetical protein